MNFKPLCIYHANCADGFGAAWVIRRYFGDGHVDFHAATYGSEPPDVAGRDVIIVDFSYNRPVLDRMAQAALSIIILDHHKSAAEDLAGLPAPAEQFDWVAATEDANHPVKVYAVFDMNRSGAMLAWDFFFPKRQPPRLLSHIQDRDLWRFEHDSTKDIMAGLFSYPYDFEVWDQLANDCDMEEGAGLAIQGEAINRKQGRDIAAMIDTAAHRMVIDGHNVPALNCPPFWASEAGHILAEREPFAACYYESDDHRHYSLRSTEAGVDVSEIARRFGGGGHRNAAGFKTDRRYCGHTLTSPEL